MNDDEGGTWPLLLGLVVGIVIIILGILLYNQIFNAGAGLPGEEECRASITANSKIVSSSAGELNSKIKCEPKKVSITTRNQKSARRQLAEELSFCWDRWQRGAIELFKGEGLFCNPCAFVTLKHDLTDLNAYLFTAKKRGSDMTYAEYLTKTSTEFSEGNVPELPKDAPREFMPSGQYAILFVYAKGEGAVGRLKDNINKNPAYAHKKIIKYSGTGAVAGGVAGGLAGYLLSAAAISALVPGPGWVVAGVTAVGAGAVAAVSAVVGAGAGAAAGTAIAKQTTLKTPQWIAQVILLPNKADEIARWGCTQTTQQVAAPPGPEDV